MAPATTALFDPLDPAVVDDPYPAYARLRRESPVHYLDDHDLWVVTRYADVMRVVRSPEVFSSQLGMASDLSSRASSPTGVGFKIGAAGVRVLIATDPPEHTLFRRMVSPAFGPGAMRQLLPEIEAITSDLLDTLLENAEDGDADFFRDVAEPLPVLVLAAVFGVPREMHEEFRDWSRMVTADLESGADQPGLGRGIEMLRYFRRELRRRRGSGGEDLLSTLASAAVTDHELTGFRAFLLVAGIETTTNLLTNLLLALMHDPDQDRKLRNDETLIDSAIEEGLRYDPPVQAWWRATTTATDLGGVELPPNARILAVYASANRDEGKFDEPDRFLVDRTPNEHLGFGNGPHFCLGSRLAKAEVRPVLAAVVHRTRAIWEREPPVRVPSLILRGLTRQPVGLEPA